MIFGLHEANALARVSYHAQELSLLTARYGIPVEELFEVKQALDQAFHDIFNIQQEKHGPN